MTLLFSRWLACFALAGFFVSAPVFADEIPGTAEAAAGKTPAATANRSPGFFMPDTGLYFPAAVPLPDSEKQRIAADARKGDALALYRHAFVILGPWAEIFASGEKRAAEKEAFGWMKKAADQGLPEAETYLGTMYRNGQGVERNREKAADCYGRAIAKGSAWAMYETAALYDSRDDGQSREKALHWLEQSAKAGYPMAKVALARYDFDKRRADASNERGMQYLLDAAKSGDPFASFIMALVYMQGKTVAKDPEEARAWMAKSASLGYTPAVRLLERQRRARPPEFKPEAGKQP